MLTFLEKLKRTDEQLEVRFNQLMDENGVSHCPNCGHFITIGDMAWNSGNTEYGTGYSTVYVHCPDCLQEVVRVNSWYPDACSTAEAIYILEEDWV